MNEIMQKCNDKMNKAVQALDKEYASIRAGRANPSILNKVNVDYYGVPTPVQQMASVSVPDPRTIMIQPYDMSTLKEIEKAIQASDLGINPNNDGKVIRLNFPPLTEERRKELVKEVKKYGEECKVTIRNIRRDILEKFKAEKKDGNITEDDLKNYEKKVQEATDKFCKEIDTLSAEKEKEIMSI
ncbi:MAG: ribosome recycling factor [Acutalibacteraceae bacterium]